MTRQERQKKYNKNFAEKHPDYMKKRLNEKYRMNEEFREQAKYRQMKNYWKRQGYNYEQYDITSDWCNGEIIEHLKDYLPEAEEFKITRIKNGWSFEIKTKIKE